MNTAIETDTAKAIVKELEQCTSLGLRPDAIFRDWLTVTYLTLRMLPRHFVAATTTGRLAQDPLETEQEFRAVRARFRAHGRDEFDHVQRAFAILMADADLYAGGNLDHVGSVFQILDLSSERAGQFLTPWDVCVMMNDLLAFGSLDIAKRLRAAALPDLTEPFATFMTARIAAGLYNPDGWLLKTIVPDAVRGGYQPVMVSDPACGSGRQLLAAATRFPPICHELGLVLFYGQDIDYRCIQMARVNLLLYGLNGWRLRFQHALPAALPHAMSLAQNGVPAALMPDSAPAAGSLDMDEFVKHGNSLTDPQTTTHRFVLQAETSLNGTEN